MNTIPSLTVSTKARLRKQLALAFVIPCLVSAALGAWLLETKRLIAPGAWYAHEALCKAPSGLTEYQLDRFTAACVALWRATTDKE